MKSIPVLITAFILVFSFSSNAMATLPNGTVLTLDLGNSPSPTTPCTAGSCFYMELVVNFNAYINCASFNGITLGAVQPASASHSGPPNGSESPDIDNPWSFFGNTGMHQTTLPVVDNGDGTLDFRGWSMTWNGIPDIPLGGDPANFPADTGLADLTVTDGGTRYIIAYEGHVPLGSPTGFGGFYYILRLEGNIILPEPVDSDGDGYTSIDTGGDDCDDTDPAVNPGSTEILNGIDDDCDGEIDNIVQIFPAGTLLTIEPENTPYPLIPCTSGSCFSWEAVPGFFMYTHLSPGPDGGVILGQIQPASGSHLGLPNGTESPSIDMPWSYFGNTGMHGTSVPIVDLGGGILDMSGWYVTWKSIPKIPMGGDPENFPGDTGFATATVSGSSYTLDYAAHVPLGDPSGYGGVLYAVRLAGEVILPPVDVDGDGYFSDIDCNDNDPLINPGATEVCNGIDDNCNNVIDEGFDLDGDGYTTCNDCNDADSTIHPGAPEICGDTIDNDCDGFTDMNDWADCGDSPCISQVTIRGGGQRPTTTDLQLQTQFTVINGGCIIEESASTLTVADGTVLVYNFKVGNGPDSDYGELNGDPINTDLVGILVCDETITGLSTNTLYLTNKGNGGKDTDRMSIRIIK